MFITCSQMIQEKDSDICILDRAKERKMSINDQVNGAKCKQLILLGKEVLRGLCF